MLSSNASATLSGVEIATETLADRVWLAINALPRRRAGGPPASARSVAIAAGMSTSALTRILNGQTAAPDTKTIESLARALSVTPAWLLHGAGVAPTPTGPVRPLATFTADEATTGAPPIVHDRDADFPPWRQARHLIIRRLEKRGADPKDIAATLNSLSEDAFYATDADLERMNAKWFIAQADERFALLETEATAEAAARAGATIPIAKSQLGARVATELDDDDGHDPEAAAPTQSTERARTKPPKAAPRTPGKLTGRTPPRAK